LDVIDVVRQRSGRRGTTVVGYQPRIRSTGSRGTPLDPRFAHVLLQGALRIDAHGQQPTYLGADRDQALFALGFATGIRRNNLTNLTTYEVPTCVSRDFTVTRVTDFNTKGDAGGDAFVFAHYLPRVWDYIDGRRAVMVASKRYARLRPLHIEADEVRVRHVDPTRPEVGVQTRSTTSRRRDPSRRTTGARISSAGWATPTGSDCTPPPA
jgi:hypothetical protein